MIKREKDFRYSQTFRDAVISEVRRKELKISQIAKLYSVTSKTIYEWMKKYEIPTPEKEVIYVDLKEKRSANDRIKKLEKRINQLETALSDKVLENCALQGMINVAQDKYGLDLKKKTGTKESPKQEI